MAETSDVTDASLDASRLDRLIGAAGSLEERIALIASGIAGRISFSTSLGLEDQVVLHAIAGAGAGFDVFTLDTGRHFPETIETIAASERRFGIKIRVIAPASADVDALVKRDGVDGFRLSVEARKSCCDVRKVMPLRACAERLRRLADGPQTQPIDGSRRCPIRHI